MNKKIKFTIVFISIVLLIVIPFIINILFKVDFGISLIQSEWSAGEALSFYGSVLSFAGTVILGYITVWQTKKANSISEKLLKNSLNESTVIPQLQPNIEIEFKENKDTTITMSTHHKLDYGAIIAFEPYDKDIERLNVYLINLYFKCPSKGFNIRKISVDDLLCVQDPSDEGLMWSDNSDSPIPLGLDIEIIKDAYLNWVSEDEFYIQLKIYCEPDKCFDSMMNNKSDTCIIFSSTISNSNGIETKMNYKIWLRNSNGISVLKTNSTFIESIEK